MRQANERRAERRGYLVFATDPDRAPDEPGYRQVFATEFEYVMRNWINDGLFTGGRLGRTKDPLTGANDPADSRFVTVGVPRVEAAGFPRFVTRGCAYLFIPSMTALRHMARVAAAVQA